LEDSINKPLILIVDDSVENLQILSALLKEDFSLRIAKTGEKALELAEMAPRPDLILLDVVMPDLNGFEVCKRIKSNTSTNKIPIIFLTSLSEASDETKGFQSGGSDFITKPFNPDIVKARIRTHLDLQAERRKSESLLQILLPDNVIRDLIEKGQHKPEIHSNVSILFFDFVGFTTVTSQLSPVFLIEELSEIFSEFDGICSGLGATRIKTIGDAYLAATGLNDNDPEHAQRLVRVGIKFIEYLERRNVHAKQQWNCRIGINSGSVIAGIVGKSRFVYDILGDDVNIAARVESSGKKMEVTISQSTKELIEKDFDCQSIGLTNLKGKGEMELFVVNRR
jgi:CheY-like chemotaxis protein